MATIESCVQPPKVTLWFLAFDNVSEIGLSAYEIEDMQFGYVVDAAQRDGLTIDNTL